MKNTLARIHTRIVLLVVVGVVAIGVGAGFAFAGRKAATPIGTGVVVVNTNLAYQGAAAAGTGIVLTSSGEVLTNNHVIAGATTVKVVLPGTGHSYTARVVGYDRTADVAVIQLQGASNLKTLPLATTSTLAVGQAVTALGNAGGTGTFTSAAGTLTALARAITVSDDQGGAEHLSGLIETNANLQPGDSGGPLLDRAGRVVGMDTAASAANDGYQLTAAGDGYAIPIGKAVTIAHAITSGKSSATIHIGGTAFLGVQVASTAAAAGYGGYDAPSSTGAVVEGVVAGGPAATAGLAVGDVITAIDGHAVTTPSVIITRILALKPGAKVALDYVDQSGVTQTATVTLGTGPAQ